MKTSVTAISLLMLLSTAALAVPISDQQLEFFESRIRPGSDRTLLRMPQFERHGRSRIGTGLPTGVNRRRRERSGDLHYRSSQ